MTRRQSLLGAITGLGTVPMSSADLKQKDPGRLRAAAVAIAVSGRAGDLAELARQLCDAGFLRRLDPDSGSVAGFGEVFAALSAHPSPATAALCLQVAQSKGFEALPARWNFLLAALAEVRPMSPEAGRLFLKMGRAGYLAVNVPLLAGNATPEALQVMELLFGEETQGVAARIGAAHRGILPNRLRLGVAASCGRVLNRPDVDRAVKLAIVESLFDNRPAEWFGKRAPYPTAPNWADASPAVRADYATIAAIARRLPALPDHLRKAIDEAMRYLGR